MRKTLTTLAIALMALTGFGATALAQGNSAAAIHISPVHYLDWKAQGYVFPAGFELYTFNYAKMSKDCREKVDAMSIANQSKLQNCGEYTISELLKGFAKVWTNNGGYSYRIIR